MKKVLFSLVALVFTMTANSQVIVSEPEFIGEVIHVIDNETSEPLEKSYTKTKIKEVFSGIAKKMYVDGRRSQCRFLKGEHQFIVRAVDNKTDPMSIVRLFKFESGSSRKVTLGKVNEFSTTLASGNKYKNKIYSARKYGNDSYIITVSLESEGEYGIIVYNPNTITESMTVVSCFGIDGTEEKLEKNVEDASRPRKYLFRKN